MEKFIFYQLFEPQTSTYTYLVADPKTRSAALVDSVRETVERDLSLLGELELKLVYILETHVHADHVTGAAELRRRTGAKIGLAAVAGISGVDLPLEDGQVLRLGELEIKVLATPGHTDACLSYYVPGMVFTGDSLMIHAAGRTDFQQGSAAKLYRSIQEKLFTLPGETRVYPAHDYRGMPYSTVALEMKFNPRIGGGKSKEEFEKIMSELKLSPPKRIHEAVPANLRLGDVAEGPVLRPQLVNDIPEISPQDVHKHLGASILLVDVRRPDEFNNELGHVQGAQLVTLGPDLMRFLQSEDHSREIVFICRSGGRSGQATAISRDFGFKNTMNMVGGMLRWNELGLPTVRD